MDKLVEMVKRHEGFRKSLYVCSAGKITVGYGHNLTDNGITEEEAEVILHNDLSRAEMDLNSIITDGHLIPGYTNARKDALIDMMFNLGLTRFSKFVKMIKAITLGEWEKASFEALDSRWADQVGDRSKEIARILKTGRY